MPFGKFKGAALEDLPADYVVWLSQLELREPLRGAVVVELGRRVLGQTRAAERRPVLAAAAPAPEIHIGDVDQDGERLPF